MKRIISFLMIVATIMAFSITSLANTSNGYGSGYFSGKKQTAVAYARLANYWFISAESFNSSGKLLDYNDHDDMPLRVANYIYSTDYHLTATNGRYTVAGYSSTGHVGYIGGDYGTCS